LGLVDFKIKIYKSFKITLRVWSEWNSLYNWELPEGSRSDPDG
jgi:hypothetical protein